MENKEKNKKKENKGKGTFGGDPSEMRKAPGYEGPVPGVNTPTIDLPAFNPPVPNRAWTEMKKGIESLSESEKRQLLMGKSEV